MTSPFNPRDVEVLAAALPGQADNPVGHATRGVLTLHAKRCTPGHYSQMFGTGPAFRDIFFPGLQPNPNEGSIAPLTGLDDGFFSAVAVAVLCQQMGWSTSRLRPQIKQNEIAGNLAGWNTRLTTNSYRFYAHMAAVTDGPIRTALAAFPDPAARAEAKRHYLAGLSSQSWVNAKKVQDASHQWFDRDWELFHHWIKLTALGATPAEIDQTIETIVRMGLPIPTAYGAGRWREQSPWFGAGISAHDAADAVGPILATKCHAYPGSTYPSCMAEDNSFEFTANSQPGNGYRQLPSSSCFAPGTRVVMADRSLRPIESVEPGDQVATPGGPREVLLRPEADRGGRVLERFEGTRFAFSATHPFVGAPGGPGRAYYAAVDPAGLARAVPMLAPFGIGPVTPGVTELTRHTAAGDEPWPAPRVEPDPAADPGTLYDLFLAVGEDGRSEYYAGDERVQLLVSSEAPRFSAAPETAWVVLRVLERVTPVILDVLASVPDESFTDVLNVGLSSLARTLMAEVGPQLGSVREPSAPQAAQDPAVALAEGAREFAGALAGPHGAGRWRPTLVFEQFATTFAGQFQAALAMGWRSFALAADDVANLLAVDVYDVEFFRPLGSGTPTTMEIALAQGSARYARRVPLSGPQSAWYLTVEGPGYFPEWGAPAPGASVWDSPVPRRDAAGDGVLPAPRAAGTSGEPLWQLEAALSPWADATARLPMPAAVAHGYESFDAPVYDGKGEPVGRIRGDVRLLTSEGFAAEWRAHERWRPADGARLAGRLADLAAEFVAAGFQRAVEQFRFCAATTTTP